MGGLYYSFQFPPNKRASAQLLSGQARKVLEEANETAAAIVDGETPVRICEEAFDTIVAAEGVLRKFSPATQDAAYGIVVSKGNARDDWSI